MTKAKLRDLLERVGWTFIQVEISLGALEEITSTGINLSLAHQLYVGLGAAATATIKVLAAQYFGKSPSGSLPDTSG